MLSLYLNNRYILESDTPRSIILFGIDLQIEQPSLRVSVRNDFGDEWELREYIDKIERFTAIRIPEKAALVPEGV